MLLLGGVLVLAQVGAAVGGVPAVSSQAATAAMVTPASPVARGTVVVPGLPAIGKWMLDSTLGVAHWLGRKAGGRELQEPINVIVIDHVATTPDEATQRLVIALAAAGFEIYAGHSSGYHAVIGGQLLNQLPNGPREAFADGPPAGPSNHGRMFGPVPLDSGYLFTGAFSREIVSPIVRGHLYGSFDRARDELATRLDTSTGYHVAGFVNLDNAIVGDPTLWTGDHDGVAVMLVATS